MSEPMSAPEVEDVVSSIRRLVSPEHRPVTRILQDKLILTPSLRVITESVPAAVPEVVPEAAPVVIPEVALEAVAEVAPDALTEAVPEAAAVEADNVLHLIEAEWEDEIWPEPEQVLSEITEQIEDAELITAPVATVADTAWPEDQGLPTEQWQHAETDWVDEAPIPFAAHQRPDVVITPEPVVAAPVAAEPMPDEPQFAEGMVAEPGSEDAILPSGIDNEVLQAIVRDLIRQELQGDLGERITRNVRKLVRAEINRALAARSFD